MKFVKVNSIPDWRKGSTASKAEQVITAFLATGYRYASLDNSPWKLANSGANSIKKYAMKNNMPVQVNIRNGKLYLTSNVVNDLPVVRKKRPYTRRAKVTTTAAAVQM